MSELLDLFRMLPQEAKESVMLAMTIVDAANDKREEDAKPESDNQPDNSQGFDFGDPSVWDTPLYQH